MNDQANKDIIDRITKLMRLASDGRASEGEIQNALSFARRLMDKHNIAEQSILLDESDDVVASHIEEVEVFSRTMPSLGTFYHYLAFAVGTLCECRVYQRRAYGDVKGYRKLQTKIIMYGQPHDVALAKALYAELVTTMHAMARLATGQSWSHRSSRSYMVGFSSRLVQRAREAKKVSVEDSSCTALVLKKDVALAKYEEGLNLKQLKSQARNNVDPHYYNKGNRDGEHVSLDTRGLQRANTPAPNQIAAA